MINFTFIKKKLPLISTCVLTLTLLLYAFLRFKISFFTSIPIGDEGGFINSFNFFINNGWTETNIVGHSILYNVFAYPFYLITSNQLLSLKLVSLISNIVSMGVIYKIVKEIFNLRGFVLTSLILLISNILIVSSLMYFAYDDNLMLPFLLILFYKYLQIKEGAISKYNFVINFGILLATFVSIREMTIIYIPVYILVLIDVFRSFSFNYKLILLFFLCFTMPLILINLPSLIDKGKLSYHDKGDYSEEVSWTQLQYLSAIKKDKGIFTKDYHVSSDDVIEYLKINGEKSLPNTTKESLFFDLKITIKEFFKDFFGLFKPLIRYIGLVFLMLFFVKIKELKYNMLMYFSVTYLALLSFIIISYVEGRWILGVFFLLTLYVHANLKNIEQKKLYFFLSLNMLMLAVFNLPFLIKNIHQIL